MADSSNRKRPLDSAADEAPKKPKLTRRDFEPRSYQKAVFDVAVRRNTIAVLETGTGKTMIAVMLIQEMSKDLRDSGDRNRLIVFLAPTVHLVIQQCEVIKEHTDLEVGLYYGALGVDDWSRKDWQRQVVTHQVLVMTPQLLLDALRKAFLTLDLVRLIIFDECHHATGKHPYSRIMKEFYHPSLQKSHVFGMTASPVIRKGVSSTTDCESQLFELESVLCSKIYTIPDRSEMDIFVHAATEVTRYHDRKSAVHECLKMKLELSWTKFNNSLSSIGDKHTSKSSLKKSPECQHGDNDDILKTPWKHFCNCHSKICLCLDNLGLVCANEAVKSCMEAIHLQNSSESGEIARESMIQYASFLEEVSHTVQESLGLGYENLLKTESGCVEAMQLGYISPKLYELLQVFKSFGSSKKVLCLVFVDRIITAKVLVRFMTKISFLSHFTVSYLTGGSSSADALSPKVQMKTLNLFRAGKVNLLFATTVAEEGLNIPDCSYVIRFDLPRTVRSYVQSRGRARQVGSYYVNMLERGNVQHRDLLFKIITSMYFMMNTASNREPDILTSRMLGNEESDAYIVEKTGAKITADSSVNLLYEYCEKLPSHTNLTSKPHFQFTYHGGSYRCTLTLPPNAAFQRLDGPVNPNTDVAKKILCLDACKRLHQLGAIDDHLRPSIKEFTKADLVEKIQASASGVESQRSSSSRFEELSVVSESQKSSSLRFEEQALKKSIDTQKVVAVKLKKGGPRSALYQLCQDCRWPMPSYEQPEGLPRLASSENKKMLQIFVSSITLQVPGCGAVKLSGKKCWDKNSSEDSAALAMLYDLQRRGRCKLKEVGRRSAAATVKSDHHISQLQPSRMLRSAIPVNLNEDT